MVSVLPTFPITKVLSSFYIAQHSVNLPYNKHRKTTRPLKYYQNSHFNPIKSDTSQFIKMVGTMMEKAAERMRSRRKLVFGQATNEEFEQQIQDLELEIAKLTSSNKDLNERLKTLISSKKELNERLDNLALSNKELTDQLAIAKKSNQTRTETHGTDVKTTQGLETENISLKTENDWVKKAFTEEKERTVQAREEILSLRTELKELRAKRDEENQKNMDWLRDTYSKKRKASPE
ncbi:hypothetical protein F4680DRAFT_222967 [Xylaria scruposa]|nr:hypothetical protein F4680DRAFT_222967 [Xylaria scruposa]